MRTIILLSLLILQNAGQTILITYAVSKERQHVFQPALAALLAEILKLILSVVVLIGARGISGIWEDLRSRQLPGFVALVVPSVVYTIQNQLVFLSLQYLDAPTFQVLSQLKIVFTALFSMLMLGTRLDRVQWCSLALLAIGTALLNIPECAETTTTTATTKTTIMTAHHSDESDSFSSLSHLPVVEEMVRLLLASSERLRGMLAVCCLCALSGFAGIYTEKMIKKQKLHFFHFNAELALISSVFGFFAFVTETQTRGFGMISAQGIVAHSLWEQLWNSAVGGVDAATIAVVCSFALGGLLVSAVVKMLSSVTKLYAATVALAITIAWTAVVLHSPPSQTFWSAAVVVSISVVLYNSPLPPPPAVCSSCERKLKNE